MVDLSHAHVWAWDARPYPFFPSRISVWSDGENYARGHWLNGRTSHQHLAGAVSEICARSGVYNIDTKNLDGIVRGYLIDSDRNARAALQPLMLAYGFDAMERNGTLTFRNRTGRETAVLAQHDFVDPGEQNAVTIFQRDAAAEISGRVRLTYVEADGDFGVFAEEAIFPDDVTYSVSQSELALSLTNAEAREITQRWLAEGRVARDGVQFSLPQSQLGIGAGDVVELSDGATSTRYRIDRVEKGDTQQIEAVRIEPGVYIPSDHAEVAARLAPFVPPIPVEPVFLDLPLLSDAAIQHAPYIAVTAQPWPGAVAVYSSASDEGYGLNTLIHSAATIGLTENILPGAAPFIRDNGIGLQVKLATGGLTSASWSNVLNGTNVAAIGDGSSGNWEVFQFETANLIAPDTYELSGRLRGQFGTDAIIPTVWPVGSMFVLLDETIQQIDMASSARGLARHYRIGAADRGYDDPSYQHRVEVFHGTGLRPYSPAHLKAAQVGPDLEFRWIRRSRIDADSWVGMDVPLGEASEGYFIRVEKDAIVIREETTSQPQWLYTADAQSADGIGGTFSVSVAQVSERFGPGLFSTIVV